MMRGLLILMMTLGLAVEGTCQDANALLAKVKAKLQQVNDYVADGTMKTDVPFIKAPPGPVKIYYKKPDKFKLKRNEGIFILPKGGVSANMNTLLSNDFTPIPSGDAVVDGTKVSVIRLLPVKEGDVVLTTLYIDEKNLLIRKASTTTKENGTYETQLNYGKFSQYGLPSQVIFTFSVRDYKLPKGVTMEFESTPQSKKTGDQKGRIEITYSSYIINKGLAESEF